MNPRVTSYLPNRNYNRKGFLTQALDSLIAQPYANLEILVIDDGSEDGSQEVIRSYAKKDSRIRYWLKDHPEGLRWGQGWLNFAFTQCTGEFFSILDSDD